MTIISGDTMHNNHESVTYLEVGEFEYGILSISFPGIQSFIIGSKTSQERQKSLYHSNTRSDDVDQQMRPHF